MSTRPEKALPRNFRISNSNHSSQSRLFQPQLIAETTNFNGLIRHNFFILQDIFSISTRSKRIIISNLCTLLASNLIRNTI